MHCTDRGVYREMPGYKLYPGPTRHEYIKKRYIKNYVPGGGSGNAFLLYSNFHHGFK
jgi:hypothetical protein